MTNRSIGIAVLTALVLVLAAPASAQQAKCLAGKTGCMAKKAAGLLKCEAIAETPGKPPDPNAKDCVTKVRAKFDGGSDPAKGCFEKLESKSPNDCLTVDDTAAGETAVDACVAALVEAIDPPPLDQSKCGAGKKKCASKYLGALLKCRKVSQTPGKPTDPNAKGCVDKAVAKYTGGADPAKGCFAKLEAKAVDCQSTTDSPTVQGLVENYCVFILACNPVDCSDSNSCTADHCDPLNGCFYTEVDCNDNDACTDDTCDPNDIGCVNTPVDCDDDNACTNDTCDPADGTCSHTPVDCSDGLQCTDDICVPSLEGGFSCDPVFDPSNCGLGPSCADFLCSIGRDCQMEFHDERCPPHPSGVPCLSPRCTAAGCGFQDTCTFTNPDCNGCPDCSCSVTQGRCVETCPQ